MCAARDATESIELLLLSLEQLEHSYQDKNKAEDLTFLRSMLKAPEFHSLLDAHNSVLESTDDKSPKPVLSNVIMATNIIQYDAEEGHTREEAELSNLLSESHVAAILTAHDKIANKEYPLQSVADTGLEGAGEGQNVKGYSNPVRVVHMEKKDKPLGATVKTTADHQIVISRVLHGGVASRSGMLHQGDVVLEINGQSVRGWTIDQVATYMQSLTGTIAFKIIPATDIFQPRRRIKDIIHVKSLVDYKPNEDKLHPCPEAGLNIPKGTLLHVLDQEDSDWWQAVVDGEERDKIGLIPSKKHLEYTTTFFNKPSSQKKVRDKPLVYGNPTVVRDGAGVEIRTYEQITKIAAPERSPRPLVLVAPRRGGFSLLTLKDRLVSQNSDTFGTAVQHTTREPRSDERNGHHFHFVSVARMEQDIMHGRMIEHGIVRGSYYGTSMTAVRDVSRYGKTCLLVVDPHAINSVRNGDIKPFIVYFKVPDAAEMKSTWVEENLIKDSDVADILRQAKYLEDEFGHVFDYTLAMKDIDIAYHNMVQLTQLLRTNEQWVPVQWLE